MVRLNKILDLKTLRKINNKFLMKCPFEDTDIKLFCLEIQSNSFYCLNCERSGEVKIPKQNILNNIVRLNKLSS